MKTSVPARLVRSGALVTLLVLALARPALAGWMQNGAATSPTPVVNGWIHTGAAGPPPTASGGHVETPITAGTPASNGEIQTTYDEITNPWLSFLYLLGAALP